MANRIYLDYAATTPVDPRVLAAMRPYFNEKFGNAGSIHSYGQEAMRALDKSRETIANSIGAKFGEIVFTSSATEANNLALRGVLNVRDVRIVRNEQAKRSDKRSDPTFRPRIIISAIEHESILETARDLEEDGVDVVYLQVDKDGLVDLKQFKKELNEQTVLISIMYANNEIGTIQPIQEIAKIIREFKERNPRAISNKSSVVSYPLLHTDAVQAFNYLDCSVDNLHVDMMALSSHKIYGPKGAGALYIRSMNDESRIKNNRSIVHNSKFMLPILTGGGQEFGYRSSTENIPAIVGFAKAADISANSRELSNKEVSGLRDYLWSVIKKIYPKAQINGSVKNRLPNNLNVYLPGVPSEEFIIKLDLAGIAISSGSACAARSLKPSYVIEALGYSRKRAEESVRITLGRSTNIKTVDKFVTLVKNLHQKLSN